MSSSRQILCLFVTVLEQKYHEALGDLSTDPDYSQSMASPRLRTMEEVTKARRRTSERFGKYRRRCLGGEMTEQSGQNHNLSARRREGCGCRPLDDAPQDFEWKSLARNCDRSVGQHQDRINRAVSRQSIERRTEIAVRRASDFETGFRTCAGECFEFVLRDQ